MRSFMSFSNKVTISCNSKSLCDTYERGLILDSVAMIFTIISVNPNSKKKSYFPVSYLQYGQWSQIGYFRQFTKINLVTKTDIMQWKWIFKRVSYYLMKEGELNV